MVPFFDKLFPFLPKSWRVYLRGNFTYDNDCADVLAEEQEEEDKEKKVVAIVGDEEVVGVEMKNVGERRDDFEMKVHIKNIEEEFTSSFDSQSFNAINVLNINQKFVFGPVSHPASTTNLAFEPDIVRL